MKLLLNESANVNAKRRHGTTSLHIAMQWGHLRIVEQVLKHEANIDSSLGVDTPLYLAVEYGHEKIVKLLLECRATTNSKDEWLYTYEDTTPCM